MTTLLTVGQDSSTTNALYRKRIVKIPFVQQVNMAPKMSLTAVNANGTRTLVIRAPLLRFGLNGAAVSQATATTNSSAVTSNAAASPAIVARPTTSLIIRRPMNLIPHFQRPPTLHPVIQQQQQQPSATAATSSNNIVTIRSASNVVFNNNNISSNELPNNAPPVQSAPSVVTLKMPSGFHIRPTPIVQHRLPKPSALNASVYANYNYVQQGNARPPSSVRKVMRHRNPTPSPSPPQEGVPNNICTVNRQHRYRNPTPSPSPPQDSNESSYLLRKAYIRNPTPPPSPERTKKVVMSQQFGMRRLSFPNGSLLTLHKAPMNLHKTAAASAVDVEHLPIMSSSSFDVETSVDLNARNCEDVEECVDGDEQDVAFVADMNDEEDESASSRQSSSQADDSSGTPGVNFFDDLTPYEDIFNSCSNLSDSGQQPQQAIGLKTAYGKQQPMLEELEKFALEFKRKRIKLGFTQCDVSVAIGKMYDVDYSQTTVSRFEALNLSFRNMCRLKPLLERWLIDTETAIKKGMFEEKLINHLAVKDESSLTKRRKKRTIIEGTIKRFLEAMYQKQRKPSLELIDEVAASLNFTSETIRTWFCNRRQRDQRSMPPKSPLQPMDDDELGDDEEVAQRHYSRQGRGVSFAVEGNSSSRSSAVLRNRSSATYASSNNKNGLNSSSSSAVHREDDDDRFDKTPSPRRDDDGDDLDEMMIAPLLSSSSRQHSSVVVSTSSSAVASTTRQAVLLVRDSASSSSHHFDDEQQLDFHDNSDEDGDDVNGSFLED